MLVKRGCWWLSRATKEEDAFHFVSYLPFEGAVYELDGLTPGPLCLGGGTEVCRRRPDGRVRF